MHWHMHAEVESSEVSSALSESHELAQAPCGSLVRHTAIAKHCTEVAVTASSNKACGSAVHVDVAI